MLAALSLLIRFWKPLAIAGVLAAGYGWHWNEVRKARNEGFAMCEAQARADVDRRIKNALEAERRIIFGNDADRMRDDGFKRKDQ